MKKRADRFVVGFAGVRDYVYGKDVDFGYNAIPMTRRQTEKHIKDLGSDGIDRIIFKLVEIKRIKGGIK